MATAHVRVVNAISGEEILPEVAVSCADLATNVRSLLGSRPSRPATLFHNCTNVEHVQAAPGDRLQLVACIGMGLSQDDRAQRLQELQDADAGSDFDSDDSDHVRQVFAAFSEVERDEAELVSAAVQRDSRCLESASEQCRDDRNIVSAAVRQYSDDGSRIPSYAWEFAGGHMHFRWRVPAAVHIQGGALMYAGEACRHDKNVVLAAVRQNGYALMHACEAFKTTKTWC